MQAADRIDSKRLEMAWPDIASRFGEISETLESIGSCLPQDNRKRVQNVAKLFQSEPDFEEILKSPDALATILPLVDSKTAINIESELPKSLQKGICSLGWKGISSQKLFQILVYPILTIMLASLFAIAFASWVAPEFETIYKEFGIQLPTMTIAVFKMASFIRSVWPTFLSVGILVVSLLLIAKLDRSSLLSRRLENWLKGSRHSLANWAWHQSLLLTAGVDEVDSIRIAGLTSEHPQLAASSEHWSRFLANHDVNHPTYFTSSSFSLLNQAMNFHGQERIRILREVAFNYWNRERTVNDWWIHWVSISILMLAAALILFLFIALFLPMLALISGLTGGSFLW